MERGWEVKDVVRTTDEQAFSILDDLTTFVHRVTTNENASPAELEILPELAKILLGHAPIYG